jgi:hypothetical protein
MYQSPGLDLRERYAPDEIGMILEDLVLSLCLRLEADEDVILKLVSHSQQEILK